MMQLLMLHIEEGNAKEAIKIVEGNPEMDLDNSPFISENGGITPLGQAIKYHRIEIAEYLVQRGSNVNAVNKVIKK